MLVQFQKYLYLRSWKLLFKVPVPGSNTPAVGCKSFYEKDWKLYWSYWRRICFLVYKHPSSSLELGEDSNFNRIRHVVSKVTSGSSRQLMSVCKFGVFEMSLAM